jgi:hypothetical protein
MDVRAGRGVVTPFEKALISALHGIRESLDALVLLNAPEGQKVPDGECDHDWVDLGDEKQCRKCQIRQPN